MSIKRIKSKITEYEYCYKVIISYKDYVTNERKKHTKSGFISYEDASLYEQKKKEELSFQHQYLKKYRLTLDELFHEWLDVEAKFIYQDNTIIDYQNRYYKHIKNKLGHLMVSDINYQILQKYFNNNYHIGLSTNYKLKKILNTMMNYAIKCNYCQMNYVPLIHVSGHDNTRYSNHHVYNDQQFNQIVMCLLDKQTHNNNAFVLALYIGKYTGLRISETFALCKDDFRFDSQTISVSKKIVYANKKKEEIYIQNKTKTKSSKTSIPFHYHLQMIMKQWFKYHHHYYVISDKKGKLMNPKQLEFALWKISQETNNHFHYHMLRHTLATKLINNGADLKSTQEIMRHANISTTMNIYAHVSEEKKLDALYVALPKKE